MCRGNAETTLLPSSTTIKSVQSECACAEVNLALATAPARTIAATVAAPDKQGAIGGGSYLDTPSGLMFGCQPPQSITG